MLIILRMVLILMLIENVSCWCKAVDCEMTEWTKWSLCDKSCGGGLRMRFRYPRVHPQCNGVKCPVLNIKRGQCNSKCCPIDCRYGPWIKRGQCQGCGRNGSQTLERKVISRESCGGRCDKLLVKNTKCDA
eukprot:TCONS_00062091-protein